MTSTFVFADLAGYTALTEAHGDERAAQVAAAFCDELRALLGDYGAEEIKAVGDSLIVRVSDAGQALHLATRIVGDFGARDRALGVRVGMHTGTAVRRGDDWFGSAVNVASRIADLAHAGEVIVSAATRDAATSSVLAGQLRPRGRRSLKHAPEPVEVFALVVEGGDGSGGLPIDPVCRITVDPAASDQTTVWRGVEYHFCSSACAEAFRAAPTHYVSRPESRALVLVSDEARESAARRLAGAYAKGRIDGAELEQRLEGTWSARTRADLDAVTHDLRAGGGVACRSGSCRSSRSCCSCASTALASGELGVGAWGDDVLRSGPRSRRSREGAHAENHHHLPKTITVSLD